MQPSIAFKLIKSIKLITIGLFFFTGNALSADIDIDLTSPTSQWKEIMKGSTFDPDGDSQAGSGGIDLVGDDKHSVLSTLYDDQATDDEADDQIAYRIRIGDGLESALYIIGIDATLDGKIDLFLAANSKDNPKEIQFFAPGNKANTSPRTENDSAARIFLLIRPAFCRDVLGRDNLHSSSHSI